MRLLPCVNAQPIKPVFSLFLLATLLLPVQASYSQSNSPLRLAESLNLSEGFSLSGSHRTRFENISDSVRPANSINDQVLAQRTILAAGYKNKRISVNLELMDSRQHLADTDSIIGTGTVNTLDLLQANMTYAFQTSKISNQVKVGRFTTDWGSRRLVARNRFRNTLNSFEGLELVSRSDSGNQLKVLASRPVRRLPSDRASLLDNERESDESSEAAKLFGVHLTLPNLLSPATSELYLIDFREKDTADVNTRNRRLQTIGVRVFSPAQAGSFDFDWESMYQSGQRHSSTNSSDVESLQHRAFFHYLKLGYTFDTPSKPHLLFEFDYGSGDGSPNDDSNERFDSLYGVTTFEFGPGGLYGPTSRSNIVSPGLRLVTNPRSNLNLMFSYRHFWLASNTDSWGRTGLRDPSGNSGSYLGQHLESRVRWDVVPGNIRIEGGAIFLKTKNLSNKNSLYSYIATVFTF